jgi:AraC family transcriptional regulator
MPHVPTGRPAEPTPHAAYRGCALRRWALPELTLSEDRYDADLALPVHAHGCASLVTVLEGGYAETAEGRRYDVGPHGLLFQPAGMPHRDEFSGRGARCFRVEIAPAWAGRLGGATWVADAPFHVGPSPEAAPAAALYRELRRPDDLSPLAVDSVLAGFFVGLARRRRRGGEHRTASRPPWLDHVVVALHDQLLDPPSLAELGLVAGAHPGHVARVFRRYLGRSVGAYVREARVAVARERLARTAEPLARVAAAAGFCDESHLARAFRRHLGVSPGEYRRGLTSGTTDDSAA